MCMLGHRLHPRVESYPEHECQANTGSSGNLGLLLDPRNRDALVFGKNRNL